MRNVRLALCQIECHPALYLDHISYLEEPFVPTSRGPSLSLLAAKGVQVDQLQMLCLREYSSWALTRLEHVFDELAKFNPIPDIIIFPEGAVQISGLRLASACNSESKSTVLAGTHTPLSTTDAKQEYSRAGIPSKRIKKLREKGVRNVLPLTYGGKTKLIEKKSLSPFEQSIISRPTKEVTNLRSVRLNCSDGVISILPMICAEALQPHRLPNSYDLVAVISYDFNPDQFLPFVEQQVSNHKAVAYCNDGRAGGTMLYCVDDQRRPNWLAARRNRLQDALEYAKEVFRRNRRDTWLLAELAKIALTQSQDHIAEELISIAKNAHIEDVSILIVEGRMYLRRKELVRAETVFLRAKQLTDRNPWPFFFLGRTYMQLGRLDDAVDVLYDGEIFIHDSKSRNLRALQAIKTQLGLAYLFLDDLDLAAPIIDSLFEEDPNRPEVIRAYAALTIKRDGITEAHEALKHLEKAKVRTRLDRCQFHLLYGLFYLGIGNRTAANLEFSKAHAADRQNVFVMIKQARTSFDLAKELWIDGNDTYVDFVKDCANLVRQILKFDIDNEYGKELLNDLRAIFGKEV